MYETESQRLAITAVFESKFANIYTVQDYAGTLLVKANLEYIPKSDFENIFRTVTDLAIKTRVDKVIFDKTALRVFHQPSMEWYFTVWKESVYEHGVRVHRKILPDDVVFCESARIARRKLEQSHPNAKFQLMDIRYSNSLFDALNY